MSVDISLMMPKNKDTTSGRQGNHQSPQSRGGNKVPSSVMTRRFSPMTRQNSLIFLYESACQVTFLPMTRQIRNSYFHPCKVLLKTAKNAQNAIFKGQSSQKMVVRKYEKRHR